MEKPGGAGAQWGAHFGRTTLYRSVSWELPVNKKDKKKKLLKCHLDGPSSFKLWRQNHRTKHISDHLPPEYKDQHF